MTNSVFNLQAALNGANVKTKGGQKARVICQTRDKILVQVYSNICSYKNYQAKYNLDGTRWSANNPSNDDLVMD